MKRSLPTVFDFVDVKLYLRAYRAARKVVDEGFSNTYICFTLGQKNSKGYFNNVINGRVKIGPTIVERFIPLLELDEDEASYFRAMVNYSQSYDNVDQEQAFREMVRFNRTTCTELSEKSLSYYLHWRYAVVRALLDVIDFDGSHQEELSSRLLLPLSSAEIDESLSLLQELSLISLNEEGFWKPSDSVISHSPKVHQELLLHYQSKSFAHSSEMVIHSESRPQKATTMTLSMSESTYNDVQDRIRSLNEEIRTLISNESEEVERLYQLNIHLFPHSK